MNFSGRIAAVLAVCAKYKNAIYRASNALSLKTSDSSDWENTKMFFAVE